MTAPYHAYSQWPGDGTNAFPGLVIPGSGSTEKWVPMSVSHQHSLYVFFCQICLFILQGCPYIPTQLLILHYGRVSHMEEGGCWKWKMSLLKSHFPTLSVYYLAFPWGAGTADGGQHGYGERNCLQVCLVLLWAPGKIWQWSFIRS